MTALIGRRDFVRRAVGLAAITVLGGCGAPLQTTPKATKAWRIGYLGGGVSARVAGDSETFWEALRDLGYVEGAHVVIEIRSADTVLERIPGLAAELLGLPVDILVTTGTPAALAARRAAGTIPVVFIRATDPVGQGIVASLARPGGNVTGVSAASLGPKQLEMLHAVVPGLKRIAVLWNANNPGAALQLQDTEVAARALKLSLEAFAIHDPGELEVALDKVARSRPDGLLVAPAFNIAFDPSQIPDFASKMRLPQIYSTDVPFVKAGGLMALGSNFAAEQRSAARLVDKILKGARPGDLPVELPTQIDFLINLSAAERIGLALPEGVVRQATEVIR